MGGLRGYHAHIYFDADEVEAARDLAARANAEFGCPVGHFHLGPVGPHPRGSCQLSLRKEQFGPFAAWAVEARGELTIFAHGLSGDDPVDHSLYAVWFGPSEELDVSALDPSPSS